LDWLGELLESSIKSYPRTRISERQMPLG